MQPPPQTISNQSRPRLWLVGTIVLVAAVLFGADLLLPPGVGSAVLYLLVVVLALRARQPWFVMAVAGGCTCLAVAGLVAALPRGLLPGAVLPETLVNRLLILVAIWTVAVVGFQREQRDEERREQARRREMILHSALDAVVSIDDQSRVIAWNPQAELTFGWTEQEALGKDLAELIIPERFRQTHRDGLRAFLTTGVGPILNRRLELAAMRRGREEFPVELSILPLRLAKGYQFSAFVRDITDRRRAERITALLAAVVESSDDSIVSLDLEGNVSGWNRGAAAMYGYSEAEMIGTSILRIVPPQSSEETERILEQALCGERVRNHEVVWSAKDGRAIDVSLTVSPILNTAREIVGISTIGHDISESKRNEESLHIWAEELKETTRESVRRKKEAEEANRAKSQFLANMSHELRTPLNAIIGYSEMLQEDVAALGQPSMAVDLDRIRVAGKHLLKLINDVLDLSKVEFGKMDIFIESFEIPPFIEEVASTVKPLVEENGNSLTVECDAEIGEMRSDRTKVRQCLFNLLSNASKFTDHGKIRLKISKATQGARSWIDFEVNDTGIGISKEQLEKVFDAFVQAESSTSRKYGGTGLGLTLTKGFCELLGGQLIVQSEEGRGSTFVVRLPAEGANPEWESVTDPWATRSFRPEDPPRMALLLLIEDDPLNRDMLSRRLMRRGFDVVTAETGEQALEMAKANPPHLVLMDMRLPRMDGWETTRRLKAAPETAGIPIIGLTAHAMASDRQRCLEAGCDDYQTKPVDLDVLVKAIGDLLARQV